MRYKRGNRSFHGWSSQSLSKVGLNLNFLRKIVLRVAFLSPT
jgi:hypothetical protein